MVLLKKSLSYLNPRQCKSMPNLKLLLLARENATTSPKNDDDTGSVSSTSTTSTTSTTSDDHPTFDESFLRQFVVEPDEETSPDSTAASKEEHVAPSPRQEALRHLGTMLWQWKLEHGNLDGFCLGQQQPDEAVSAINKHLSQETIHKSMKAVDAILVLKDHKDPKTQHFLADYQGHLISNVRESLLTRLQHHQPDRFSALVGDFNDNMAYHMEQGRGSTLLQREEEHQDAQYLEDLFQTTLHANESLEYQGSFLTTQEQTIPQPAHVDFSWQVLASPSRHDLTLAFCPLTRHGMMLQVWPRRGCTKTSRRGLLVWIPYGTMLLLPSDTIHGGGFRTCGGQGNLRYHWYLAKAPTTLPRFAKNVYTHQHDTSQWLDTTCLPALGLPPASTTSCSDKDTANEEAEGLLMDLLFE